MYIIILYLDSRLDLSIDLDLIEKIRYIKGVYLKVLRSKRLTK